MINKFPINIRINCKSLAQFYAHMQKQLLLDHPPSVIIFQINFLKWQKVFKMFSQSFSG